MTPAAHALTRSIIEQLIQMLPSVIDDGGPGGRTVTIGINAERTLARIETTSAVVVRAQPPPGDASKQRAQP